MGMNKIFLIFSIICALVYFFLYYKPMPSPTGVVSEYSIPNVLDDPIQDSNKTGQFTIKNNSGEFIITPQASYKITGLVVSKTKYFMDWNAAVAPFDVALVWGKLTEPKSLQTVNYSQHDRWYYYRYSADFPYDNSYISSHSSNNHIIPADDKIYKVFESIQNNQIIYLEGYLVYIDATLSNNNHVWWHSSLTRNDTADGACELIYVNKVIIEGKVYS